MIFFKENTWGEIMDGVLSNRIFFALYTVCIIEIKNKSGRQLLIF